MDQEKSTIDKMLTFIYFEAKEKINELKIKAIEDYNTEKSRLIKQATDHEQMMLKKQTDEIKTNRLKKMSDVKMQYKIKMAEKKLKQIDNLFRKAENRLKTVRLSQNLINETLENIEGDGLIVYVLPDDTNRVKNYHPIQDDNKSEGDASNNNLARIKEVRNLDSSFLGGIIITNTEETAIVDNSFRKRLDSIRETGMSAISKKLYGKESSKD